MWSNPTLRTAQHSTIQRPQGQGNQQGTAGPTANTQLQNQTHEEGVGAAPGQFSSNGDDYRFGGQAGVGQLSGASQPQTGNIDEFPPLGGGNIDIGPDRRTVMIQNAAAYGANNSAAAFPGLGQTRNSLSSPADAQQDRPIASALAGRALNAGSGKPPPDHQD